MKFSKFFRCIFLLLACIIPFGMSTQSATAYTGQVRFDHLTVEDGLSQSSVRAIVQDAQGFLWFGTEEGLNRYDGFGFEIFKHDPQNPNSLQSNVITSLYVDRAGDLWIGTSRGLDRYRINENAFDHYPLVEIGQDGLWGSTIEAVLQDENDHLWVATQAGGLNRLNPANGEILHFIPVENDPKSLFSRDIYDLVPDGTGGLWLATDGGLSHYDPTSGYFTHYLYNRFNPFSLSDNRCRSLFVDHEGYLWVGTDRGGLNRLISASGRFERYQNDPEDAATLVSNQVFDILQDSIGILWVATREGISLLRPGSSQFSHLRKDRNDPASLNNNVVTALFQDRGGVMWVGTFGGGVNRYAAYANKFQRYIQRPGDLSSLSDSTVFAISQTPDGTLWIGTLSGGLNRLERESGRMRYYYHLTTQPQSIASNDIRALFTDHKGTLWIGTANAGVDQFDPLTSTFLHFQIDPQNPNLSAQYAITTFFEDSQQQLWVGTRGYGFHRFQPESRSFAHYNLPSENNSAQLVRAIREDEDGNFWIATYEGVFVFDPRREQFLQHYRAEGSQSNSLSSNTILSIYVQDQDTVWFGTWSGGLNRLDRRTGIFTVFTEKDGLANDTVYAILPDSDGNLWLSTNRGLSRFEPASGRFRNFDVSDGLTSNEFNAGAAYVSPQGEFFLGSVNGLISFFPSQVQDNPIPPPVIIRSFSLYNQIERKNLPDGDSILLSYRDTFIGFEFAALDFTAPHKNQFAYKLEGFDSDWNYLGNRNFVTFTNLRGGDYTLRVKAANNDGVWNEEGIAIHLRVTPPFYTRGWFILLSGAGVLGLVYSGYRLRLHRVESQKRALEQLVLERTHEIERRRQVAEGLREIIAILNTNQSLQESLDYIIHQALQLVHARHALIFYHPPGQPPQEMAGELPPNLQAYAPLVEETLKGQITWIEDIHQYRQKHPEKEIFPGDQGALLAIPLSSGDHVDGGLILTFVQAGALPDEDYKTALTLADQAALAIGNANLRQQAEELAKISERSRIARDLHDAVTQTLFASTLIADVLPRLWQRNPQEGLRRLDELRLLSRGALAEMRSLLVELRPGSLLEADLSELIQQLCDAFTSRTRLQINCGIQSVAKQPADVQIAFYRIAQEALNNIARHAHAQRVKVTLENEEGSLTLTICDDGKGFDRDNVPPAHFGLEIMRERAQSIHASLKVESKPGEGTCIRLTYQHPQKTL